jgi:hypothetical protein
MEVDDMKKLYFAIALALGVMSSYSAYANEDTEVTIRMMNMNENSTSEVMKRINLPDSAVDKVAEDANFKHRLIKRNRTGEGQENGAGEGQGDGYGNEGGVGEMDRDRTRDQDHEQVRDMDQDQVRDTDHEFENEPSRHQEMEQPEFEVEQQQNEIENDQVDHPAPVNDPTKGQQGPN